MKKLLFISLSILLTSCFGFKENKDRKLNIKKETVKKATIQCGEDIIILSSDEITSLIDKINSAKQIGPVKGIVRKRLTIYLNNNDTINIRLLGNSFKWDKSADWAFKLNIDKDYFNQKCSEINLKKTEDVEGLLNIQIPLKTIERILNQYNEFQESTDSQDNLDSLRQSLKMLEKEQLTKTDLTLIINVWMYYTVTDFSTLEYTESVLVAKREKSIEAVKDRMRNKEEWETNDGVPFSELNMLLEKLEEK